MEIPKYSDWKESDMSWLGDIPSHWEVKSLRFIGNPIIGLTYSPDEICNDNEGVLVLRSTNIQGGKIIDKENVYVSTKINDKLTTKLNDILICSRNGSRQLIGKCGRIGKDFVGVSFGAFTTVFRSSANDFIYYVLSSQLFEYQSGLFLTTTINQLTVGAFNSFKVPLPPREEQIQIAKFLDYKTTQIDRLIEKKKALIEKLNEKRTALITQAVTKGLNPDAPMKDSGVDWLGEVPEHWEVRKLKFLCEFSTGWTPPTKQPEYFDGDNIWVTIADMDKKLIHDSKTKISDEAVSDFGFIQVPKGALLYSFKLSVGKVGFAGTNLYTNEAILFVLPNANYDINFLYYLFSVSIIKNASENIYGAKILNQELIKNSFLVYLSHKEQSQIAEFLDDKTTKIDKLANKASEAIDTLNEYRTALITAAVTGKIDVRNVELPKSS